MLKNGMLGGRERSSYAAPEALLLSSGIERRFSECAVVATDIDDLFLLCREVKWSSNGFISGGNIVILRNVTPR